MRVNIRAAANCSGAGAPDARIAIIAARYSTGGVANARPATNATTNDPPSRWPRMEGRPDPMGVFRSNTRTEPAPPVTGTGARWRARRRAATSTASTPIATCMSAKIGVLEEETTSRMMESAESRRKTSTTNAVAIPAAMPPSQKTNRLSMGRGREIKNAVIPIRTGSIATTSDSTRTALLIAGTYFPTNLAVLTQNRCSSGRRRLALRLPHREPLVQPRKRFGCPPVEPAHHTHERRDEQHAHQRRVSQYGQRQADTEHP